MSKFSLRPREPVQHKEVLRDAYKISIPAKLWPTYQPKQQQKQHQLWNLEDSKGSIVATGTILQAQKVVQNDVLLISHDLKDIFTLNFTDTYTLKKSETLVHDAGKIVLAEEPNETIRPLSMSGLQKIAYWSGALQICLQDKLISPGLLIQGIKLQKETRSFKVKTVFNTTDEKRPIDKFSLHMVVPESSVTMDISSTESLQSPEFKINRDGIFGMDAELDRIDKVLREHDPTLEYPIDFVYNGLTLIGNPTSGRELIAERISELPWSDIIDLDNLSIGNKLGITIPKVFKECAIKEHCLIRIQNLDHELMIAGKQLEIALTNAFKHIRNRKVLVLAEIEEMNKAVKTLDSSMVFVHMVPPNENARRETIIHILQEKHVTVHNIEDVAALISQETPGFSRGDLMELTRESIKAAFWSELKDKADNLSTETSANPTPSLIPKVTLNHLENARKSISPSALGQGQLISRRKVHWSDIGGQEELKKEVEMLFQWPLKYPEKFKQIGLKPGRGLLLYGPPGCSKTMTALALATEAKLNFISIKGSELLSKYVGESEHNLRNVFTKARNAAPCVIFFDEFDSIAFKSGGSGETRGMSLATTILIELDGVEENKGVSVLAATNKPWDIDEAVLRPGRFDRIMYVKLPDEAARKQILNIQLNAMQHDADVDIELLAQTTEGCSGAEIVDLCRTAAIKALQEQIELPQIRVQSKHFAIALEKLRRDTTEEMIAKFDAFASRK